MIAALRSANKATPLWCAISLSIVILCILLGMYFHARTGVRMSFLYRDANAIAGQPFYYGVLEIATGAMLLMSGAVLLYEGAAGRLLDRGVTRFLLLFGGLTVLLGLDDILMLHESAGFFYWRLTEQHVYAFYGLVLLLAAGMNVRLFLRTPFLLLGLAMCFLALSTAEDQLGIRPLGVGLEDYLEIFAFAFWSSYALSVAVAARRGLIRSQEETSRTQQRAMVLGNTSSRGL